MRKKLLVSFVLTMLLLVVVSPIGVSVAVADSNGESGDFVAQSSVDWWPMFHHDLRHTGYSTSTGPDTDDIIWTYTTGDSVVSSPAVVDGKVYVGSADDKVYCLDAETGAHIWNYTTDSSIVWASPAVAGGKVYVGAWFTFYCLDASTGAHIWDFPIQGGGPTSSAVAYGKVYVGGANALYCLNAETGAHIWSYGEDTSSSPAVVDGKVYAGSVWANMIYCVNAETGTSIWNYTTGDAVWFSSPAVVDGKVYAGSNDNKVYCLDALTGAHIWNYTTGADVQSSPAVADGKVYVGSFDGKIYCLDALTGEQIWNYTINEWQGTESSPAVADGKVYVGCEEFYCLDALTGEQIWNYTTIGTVQSSPAVADGKVYVGSNDCKVYAFGPAHTLTITTTPGGTTSPSPGTHTYPKGISVSVRALPDAYYVFDHWELDGFWNYSNPINVTMDSDHTLHAVFTYNITIEAHCYAEDVYVNVSITMDGSPTGYTTPHTFTNLTGTHTFTVPSTDPHGHPFMKWSTGETSRTITVTTGGSYTAYYQAKYTLTITTTTGGTTDPWPGTHTYPKGISVSVRALPDAYYVFDHWELDGFWNYSNPIKVTMDSDHTLHAVFTYSPIPYNVTIEAHCYAEDVYVNVSITMDGSPTGYTTPHTFTNLTGTHTFTVPSTDPHGHPFMKWSTGETSRTITVTTGGSYTAYYGTHDVAVTNVTLSKTVVGQGSCMNINVTVENQGNFTEWFGVVAPYFDGVVIPTPAQWETFWSLGDVNRDGYIDSVDNATLWEAYIGDYNPDCDFDSDGDVDIWDLWVFRNNYGSDIWTVFGLPVPPKGTQKGVKLYPGTQTTLTFTWNTTGVPYGNYTITAYANPVPGETDTADNTYPNGWVLVTCKGDFGSGLPPAWGAFDGQCNYQDLSLFRQAYLYSPQPPLPAPLYLADLGSGFPPAWWAFDGQCNYQDLTLFREAYLA